MSQFCFFFHGWLWLAQTPDKDYADKQRALETQFDSYMNRDNLRNWMKRMSARAAGGAGWAQKVTSIARREIADFQ